MWTSLPYACCYSVAFASLIRWSCCSLFPLKRLSCDTSRLRIIIAHVDYYLTFDVTSISYYRISRTLWHFILFRISHYLTMHVILYFIISVCMCSDSPCFVSFAINSWVLPARLSIPSGNCQIVGTGNFAIIDHLLILTMRPPLPFNFLILHLTEINHYFLLLNLKLHLNELLKEIVNANLLLVKTFLQAERISHQNCGLFTDRCVITHPLTPSACYFTGAMSRNLSHS